MPPFSRTYVQVYLTVVSNLGPFETRETRRHPRNRYLIVNLLGFCVLCLVYQRHYMTPLSPQSRTRPANHERGAPAGKSHQECTHKIPSTMAGVALVTCMRYRAAAGNQEIIPDFATSCPSNDVRRDEAVELPNFSDRPLEPILLDRNVRPTSRRTGCCLVMVSSRACPNIVSIAACRTSSSSKSLQDRSSLRSAADAGRIWQRSWSSDGDCRCLWVWIPMMLAGGILERFSTSHREAGTTLFLLLLE